MATAKVFKSGNSQAIRLPKEFRVDATELTIVRKNGGLLLTPIKKPATGAELYEALLAFGGSIPDFERPEQGSLQERPELDEWARELAVPVRRTKRRKSA